MEKKTVKVELMRRDAQMVSLNKTVTPTTLSEPQWPQTPNELTSMVCPILFVTCLSCPAFLIQWGKNCAYQHAH